MLVVGQMGFVFKLGNKPYIDAFFDKFDGRNIEPLIKPEGLKQIYPGYPRPHRSY